MLEDEEQCYDWLRILHSDRKFVIHVQCKINYCQWSIVFKVQECNYHFKQLAKLLIDKLIQLDRLGIIFIQLFFTYIFLESKIANNRQPAIAIAQPITLGNGNVSPAVNKYNATKITTLFSVFPTAVGTGPSEPSTMFCISL